MVTLIPTSDMVTLILTACMMILIVVAVDDFYPDLVDSLAGDPQTWLNLDLQRFILNM